MIKLIGTPSKISQINQPEKPIIITYKTWGEFDKNIGKDIKNVFPEIEKNITFKKDLSDLGVREE